MNEAGEQAVAADRALREERGARVKAEGASRRLAFVLGASQLLATPLDPEEALNSLVRLAVPTLAELCVIDLRAGDGELRRAAVAHANPKVDGQIRDFLMRHPPLAEGDRPVAQVLRTGRPEIGDDLSARWPDVTADLESIELASDFQLRSYLVVPLVARGSTLGTALLASTTTERNLGVDDLALAEDIARSAALALDTARLVADKEALLDLERAARADAELAELRLGILAEVSSAMDGVLDPDVALARLANLVVSRVADWCAVDLLDEDGDVRRVTVAHRDPATADLARASNHDAWEQPTAEAPVAVVRRAGGPVLLGGTTSASFAAGQPGETSARAGLGMRSGLVVPLIGRDAVLGALTMASTESDRHFDETDLPMAADMGRRAGLAVENARLYQQQHSVAVTLQHALLPTGLPRLPGLTAAVRYVAATSGADVGGDWYDVMKLADGRIGLSVGDAVGHSAEAAAMMGTIRNVLRAYAWSGADPAEVLSHLDDFIGEAESAHLATLVYAQYDRATRVFRWANAGHPPPLLVGPGSVTRFLEGGHRTMIGVGLGSAGQTEEITAPDGATLVLYTDGLIEERSAELSDGLDRLRKVAAAHYDAEPEKMLDEILSALLVRDRLEDDIAVLAVRVSDPPS
jgi:GAF domain-containing protein